MNFKFKILDLLAITTVAASLSAAFQADLTLFRQLLCASLIALVSTGAILRFPNSRRSVQFVGGIGGFAGGLSYLALMYLLSPFVYEPEPLFGQRAIPLWCVDMPMAVVFSVLFGATMGPLMGLRFQNHPITGDFKKPFWFSVFLLAGVFLLGIFAMFDRQSMQTRDWWVVALVLSIVFVIHTNDWFRRFESARHGQSQ